MKPNGYVSASGYCARCGARMKRESWGSDCRGNSGGSGSSCSRACYQWWDYGYEKCRPEFVDATEGLRAYVDLQGRLGEQGIRKFDRRKGDRRSGQDRRKR